MVDQYSDESTFSERVKMLDHREIKFSASEFFMGGSLAAPIHSDAVKENLFNFLFLYSQVPSCY